MPVGIFHEHMLVHTALSAISHNTAHSVGHSWYCPFHLVSFKKACLARELLVNSSRVAATWWSAAHTLTMHNWCSYSTVTVTAGAVEQLSQGNKRLEGLAIITLDPKSVAVCET